MALDRAQFRQIHDALLDGFSDFSLRQMVRFGLGADLDRIAGGGNREERVFHLVEWAERSGRERELVQAAHSHNPTNDLLQALYVSWFPSGRPTGGAAQPEPFSPQVFLSYSRQDGETMQRVQAILAEAGLSLWTDEGLEPGTDR